MSEYLLQVDFFRNFTPLDWTGWAFLVVSTLSGWGALSLPSHLTATLSLSGIVILGLSVVLSRLFGSK